MKEEVKFEDDTLEGDLYKEESDEEKLKMEAIKMEESSQ